MELAEGGHAGELLPELAGGQYDASAQYGAGAEARAAHWGGWAPGAEGSAAEEGGYSGAEAAVAPAGYGEAEPAAQYQEQYQEEYQEEQYYSSTGYSPAQYLQYLEGEVQRLSAHKAQLEQRMATAATSAYQQVSSKLDTAGTGVPIPADVPSLIEELAVLQTVRQYLQYLQELEALTRHVEKAAAALQQEAGGDGGSSPGFLAAASGAVEAFSHAMSYVLVVRQLGEGEQVPSAKLRGHGRQLVGRVEQAQATLRALLSAAIQSRLAACSWPPPLTLSSGAAGGTPTAAATGAGPAGGVFVASGAATSVEALQRLLLVQLTLQRSVQHEQFQALAELGAEPPLLWAAEELAQGVAAWLRHHFAEGLPTDRADKPEWLFEAVLRAVQQAAPQVAAFQPCIDAHELQQWYNMQLEFGRAVQAVGMNAILRQHLLPQLASMAAVGAEAEAGSGDASSALWLHYADAAMRFEKRFAPLRGALVLPVDEEEEGAAAAHAGSAIEVLFEDPAWRDGWLAAEGWDAVRQLDGACDALNAWQPAQLVLGLPQEGDDFLATTPRSRGELVASRQEFWPPAAAEHVLAAVSGLVRRCGWVAGAAHRRAFMQAVPLAQLRAFRDRLGRQLQVAEGYQAMLSEQWLPSVGAAICAAHYVEHQLREPQGVLLLIELQDAVEAPAAAATAEGAPAEQAQQAGGLGALVEREAAAFGTLRRQWAYKLAKQAVDRFHSLFAPYKHDLSVFTAGYEDGVDSGAPPPVAPAALPGEEEAGGAPVAVSPVMLVAADKLLQLLNLLAQHLDAVVFRDVWKAVALAVNYAMFNDIATEALFSWQGARQFDADVGALSAVFGQYTSRPAAHFKETKEACKLLLLPRDQAAAVLGALQRQPGAAKEVLRPMGIKLLNLDQAATVLMQRLDLLTGSQQ